MSGMRLCVIRHHEPDGHHVDGEVVIGEVQAVKKAKELQSDYPRQKFEVFVYDPVTTIHGFVGEKYDPEER